ncbi:MAG: preprotein translocase subunit SecG [Candidatus Hydrogenedentes bacterium]|nr:preprotein translocase subunit SecG [Candidatus Hydrogenedentota bacterium]
MLESIFSWYTLWVIMWILFLPACVGLIVIVLLQKGKGTGFAGAFGVGPGSETVFGPRARKSLPVKMTYVMAGIFMVLSLSMSLVAGRVHRGSAPEAVPVSEEDAASTIYDELLSGAGTAETPASTAPAEAPVTPGLEAPAEETPAIAPPAAGAAPIEAPPVADAATPDPASAGAVDAPAEPAAANQ